MHNNEALLHNFYRSFGARDSAAMGACYAPNARFNDPVFTDLDATQVRRLWTMLCERGVDLEIESSGITADDQVGQAHWEARYTFTRTGRSVHNKVNASFRFEDGLIEQHVDRFPFWAWSRQALGAPGLLLGWTPFLRAKVRDGAAKELERYGCR